MVFTRKENNINVKKKVYMSMKKLWIAFTGLCMLLLVACKDEVDGPIILIHSFDVALVDKLGNDLLDPNVDNHYEPERIRIYKIVANVEDEIHGDGLSYVPDGDCFVPILGPQSIGSPGVRLVK